VVEYEEVMMFISFSGQLLVLCKLNMAFIVDILLEGFTTIDSEGKKLNKK
jgi:hypothetical protein